MLTGIAIDAGWFRLLDTDQSNSVSKHDFLARIRDLRILLLLDQDDAILGEYHRVLPMNSTGRTMQENFVKEGLVEWRSGRVPKKCDQKLDDAGFDPDDKPYVAVAAGLQRAAYLSHESKHVSGVVAEALAQCILVCGGIEDVGPHL